MKVDLMLAVFLQFVYLNDGATCKTSGRLKTNQRRLCIGIGEDGLLVGEIVTCGPDENCEYPEDYPCVGLEISPVRTMVILPPCFGPSKHPAKLCNQYYECVSGKRWWEPKMKTCPIGEAFDSKVNECVPAESVNCDTVTSEVTPITISTTTQKNNTIVRNNTAKTAVSVTPKTVTSASVTSTIADIAVTNLTIPTVATVTPSTVPTIIPTKSETIKSTASAESTTADNSIQTITQFAQNFVTTSASGKSTINDNGILTRVTATPETEITTKSPTVTTVTPNILRTITPQNVIFPQNTNTSISSETSRSTGSVTAPTPVQTMSQQSTTFAQDTINAKHISTTSPETTVISTTDVTKITPKIVTTNPIIPTVVTIAPSTINLNNADASSNVEEIVATLPKITSEIGTIVESIPEMVETHSTVTPSGMRTITPDNDTFPLNNTTILKGNETVERIDVSVFMSKDISPYSAALPNNIQTITPQNATIIQNITETFASTEAVADATKIGTTEIETITKITSEMVTTRSIVPTITFTSNSMQTPQNVTFPQNNKIVPTGNEGVDSSAAVTIMSKNILVNSAAVFTNIPTFAFVQNSTYTANTETFTNGKDILTTSPKGGTTEIGIITMPEIVKINSMVAPSSMPNTPKENETVERIGVTIPMPKDISTYSTSLPNNIQTITHQNTAFVQNVTDTFASTDAIADATPITEIKIITKTASEPVTTHFIVPTFTAASSSIRAPQNETSLQNNTITPNGNETVDSGVSITITSKNISANSAAFLNNTETFTPQGATFVQNITYTPANTETSLNVEDILTTSPKTTTTEVGIATRTTLEVITTDSINSTVVTTTTTTTSNEIIPHTDVENLKTTASANTETVSPITKTNSNLTAPHAHLLNVATTVGSVSNNTSLNETFTPATEITVTPTTFTTTTADADTTKAPVFSNLTTPFLCNISEKYAAPVCNQYYECTWPWGYKLETCPEGQAFDVNLKECGSAESLDCTEISNATFTTEKTDPSGAGVVTRATPVLELLVTFCFMITI